MKRMWVVVGVVACACFGWTPVQAQRREGKAPQGPLLVALPVAATFGGITVSARSYRLGVVNDTLVLADPDTMVVVATLPAKVTELAEAVAEPAVAVKHNARELEFSVRDGTVLAVAVGVVAPKPTPQATDVTLIKAETTVEGGSPERQSERALIDHAMARYLPSLADCGDSAQKNRWVTDDPRFSRCVCPLVAKWRLPKISAPLLFHAVIVKGKAGLSFVASPDGKVGQCRVWVGAEPPPLPPPAPEPPPLAPPAGGTP